MYRDMTMENNISVHCKELYCFIYGTVLIFKVICSVSFLKYSYTHTSYKHILLWLLQSLHRYFYCGDFFLYIRCHQAEAEEHGPSPVHTMGMTWSPCRNTDCVIAWENMCCACCVPLIRLKGRHQHTSCCSVESLVTWKLIKYNAGIYICQISGEKPGNSEDPKKTSVLRWNLHLGFIGKAKNKKSQWNLWQWDVMWTNAKECI